MNSTDLRDKFREATRDDVTPYLWSEAEVFSYADDAQKMFCRLTGGIADATSPLTRVQLVAGEEFASISPRILKLREARRAGDGYDLEILNFEDMQARRPDEDYGFRSGFRIDNSVGVVRALVVGMEAGKVRPVKIPQDDQQLNLIIYRLPLEDIVGEGQALEISEQYHSLLLDWMMHRAHRKQDAETYDRGRSEEFYTFFTTMCDRAKHERELREHKYRSVAYGGL